MKKLSLTALLLTTALFANETPQEVIDTGDKVSKELLKKLGSKLKHELQSNGLMSAITFCNENAYILTEEINLHQLEGTTVKRISLKERNPANIPSEDEKEVLEQMQKSLEKKTLPKYIVKENTNTYKYYKPLVIKKEVCLKCHGDVSKNEKLSNFLKEHYPNDKATGYKMNDLRGAILVEIKR